MGVRADGYDSPRIVSLRVLAEQMQAAVVRFKKDGFAVVVYDAYRPQRAVDHFVRWSETSNDTSRAREYYPRIARNSFFEQGFLSTHSTHTRGAAIDLSLITLGQTVQPIKKSVRHLRDGTEFLFLDDGSVDMGSSFDLFDEASYTDSNLISQQATGNRHYLRRVMVECGFVPYEKEWWHFSIGHEPHPKTYFDFPII